MLNETYVEKLFREFNNTNNENISFEEWLEEKKSSLELYYLTLKKLGYDENKPIIELGRGNLDTIGLVIPNNNITEISEHVSIIDIPNITKIKGNLIVEDGFLKVQNGNIKNPFNLRGQQYTIQLPIYEKTIQALKYLTYLNEKVFFGISGNYNDNNFNIKCNILKSIREELKTCGIETETKTIDNDDIYATVTSNKVKTY